eukprot:14621168-Alexandrium_andersonii.AAC.1
MRAWPAGQQLAAWPTGRCRRRQSQWNACAQVNRRRPASWSSPRQKAQETPSSRGPGAVGG